MIIGIDLGTTNSVAAYMADDGPVLIPNSLGHRLTPSVVGIDLQGELVVGLTAKELQVLHPQRCASLFKRQMGTDWRIQLANRTFTPEELSGLVLKSLKLDAEAHLGEPVERAVITVPAYFNDDQRSATLRAGRLAGLQVDRIINEPTAAAIAYGLKESEQDKVVAVFDLGGGTFDISIVEMFEGSVEVRSSAGECFLGGEDFTRLMAARVLELRGQVFEHLELQSPALVSRMVQQCEKAKCTLTAQPTASVAIADRDGEITDDADRIEISRADLAKWTEHVLARVELPIRRALGDANLKRSDIDEVILVGGATRMQTVIERVTELFQLDPQCRLNPDEVVALGAAVQAGLIARNQSLDDLVVTDVAPFTLGVSICKSMGMELRDGYFLPIIDRNTTIPVSRVKRVGTTQSNQTQVEVEIYQGEGRRVEENLLLGRMSVTDIPRGPAGQQVDIRFTYDLSGVLEVEATIVETGKKLQIVIAKPAKGLSERDIASVVEKLQQLKTHPREEAKNRFLLKRAERVYRELPLFAREVLSELLDGFEGALGMQDGESIERHREALESFLDDHDA